MTRTYYGKVKYNNRKLHLISVDVSTSTGQVEIMLSEKDILKYNLLTVQPNTDLKIDIEDEQEICLDIQII